MPVQLAETTSPEPHESAPRSQLARWRHESGAAVLIVIALAVIVGTGWFLYNRPAHEYSVGAHSVTWTSDVTLAIAESKNQPVGPLVPTGPLRAIPGVGRIVSVLVDKGSSHRVAVLFLTSEVPGAGESGLVYLKGFPALPDACNLHLSGPWWQVGLMNITSNSCARGFTASPGG
jgi:hypothetical protein